MEHESDNTFCLGEDDTNPLWNINAEGELSRP